MREIKMTSKKYTIPFEEGMHARPATLFVQTVKDFPGVVQVLKGEREIDGKSILQVMMLGARKDEVIEVRVEGEEAGGLFEKLDAFFGLKG